MGVGDRGLTAPMAAAADILHRAVPAALAATTGVRDPMAAPMEAEASMVAEEAVVLTAPVARTVADTARPD